MILGQCWCHIVINDKDGGTECTLSTFGEHTELGGVADSPQRHGVSGNLMKFSEKSCKWEETPQMHAM